eukprot:EG_transcript_11426
MAANGPPAGRPPPSPAVGHPLSRPPSAPGPDQGFNRHNGAAAGREGASQGSGVSDAGSVSYPVYGPYGPADGVQYVYAGASGLREPPPPSPVYPLEPLQTAAGATASNGWYPTYGPKGPRLIRVRSPSLRKDPVAAAPSPWPGVADYGNHYSGSGDVPSGLAGYSPLRRPDGDPDSPPGFRYDDDGGIPPPNWLDGGEELTVQNFLCLNPRLDLLIKERDGMLGWRRYLEAGLFAFALFSPILGMVTRLLTYSWVLALLWVMIGAIMVFWIEYRCRAELWYICICRGIILDFKKTDKLLKWALHPVMFIGYFFIIICTVIVGLASTTLDAWQRIVSGVLFAVGLAFVITLIKEFVDLEGAPNTLTVNMLLFLFKNPRLMRSKGLKLVHYTQFVQYFLTQGQIAFRWDDVFQLSEQPTASSLNPLWAVKANWQLRRVKDMKE